MVPSSHGNKIDVLSPFFCARDVAKYPAENAIYWASFQSKLSHLSKIMASKIAQLSPSCEQYIKDICKNQINMKTDEIRGKFMVPGLKAKFSQAPAFDNLCSIKLKTPI